MNRKIEDMSLLRSVSAGYILSLRREAETRRLHEWIRDQKEMVAAQQKLDKQIRERWPEIMREQQADG